MTVTLVFLFGPPLAAPLPTFAPGDVFLSLETGQVQWWSASGTLKGMLVGVEKGSAATGNTPGSRTSTNIPMSSSHSFGEVLRWFHQLGVEFIGSIPSCIVGDAFRPQHQLFERRQPGWALDHFLVQLGMLLAGDREGGFFNMIGRTPPESRQIGMRNSKRLRTSRLGFTAWRRSRTP